MGRTRRELLIGTGLVATGGILIVRERGQFESSSPPPSTVQPPALCTTTSRPGVYWNIAATANLDPGYQYYVDALERSLRRRFAGVRKNYFAGPGQPEISPEVTMAYAAGRRWTYVNGKPNPIPQDGRFLQWTSVAAGLYDDQFTQLFAAVRNDRRWDAANPFHFSFHHEQEVTSEGGGRLAGSPQDFQAAFWRVRALMDAAGAHVGAGGNMLMCWTPDWLQFFRNGDTGWSGYPYDASNCDPYDPVRGRPYDLLGCDVYRRSGASFDAPTMWEPVQRWANM
ncbi:MAG TPA: hypothetical protein VKV34_03685, partial [Thermoleophilia bacterium]|nr:hypothetical protein [Thermoleophilia bacterium]